MVYKLICFSLAIASVVNCNKLPGVTRCLSTLPQPAFDECIFARAKNFLPTFARGLPALRVPATDPLVLDHVSLSESNLRFDLYNSSTTGISAAKLERFHLDLENGITNIIFSADLKFHGKYVLNGQLIKAVQITGSGDIDIDIRNIRFVIEVDFKRVKHRNGIEHFKLTNYTSEYDVLDKATFNLTNLFEGRNELLAKTAIAVINEDWEDMMMNVAKPAIRELVAGSIAIIDSFFDAVSVIELYPEMANSVQ